MKFRTILFYTMGPTNKFVKLFDQFTLILKFAKPTDKPSNLQLLLWVEYSVQFQFKIDLLRSFHLYNCNILEKTLNSINWMTIYSKNNILNQKPWVLLLRSNLVRLRASKSELSVNTTEESHKIGLLSIQIDKYEKTQLKQVFLLSGRDQ